MNIPIFLIPRRKRLIYAVKNGNYKLIAALIKKGANINDKDHNGITLLNMAICRPNAKFVEVLLIAGADVNQLDESGMSPLHFAAMLNNSEIIPNSISHGAMVESRTKDTIGYTPLHLAAQSDAIQSINSLIDLGAELEARTYTRGLTPFFVAAEGVKFAAILELAKRGANINAELSEPLIVGGVPINVSPHLLCQFHAQELGISSTIVRETFSRAESLKNKFREKQ